MKLLIHTGNRMRYGQARTYSMGAKWYLGREN